MIGNSSEVSNLQPGEGGGVFKVIKKEGGCFHFLDRLTLVGVANGWVYCLKGSFVSCNYWGGHSLLY